ncbi:MAG TPA: GNAT family N-acetyltransferase [Casimicrobiaceae bacterium]
MSGAAVSWAIRDATTRTDIVSARTLFEEYAASLDIDLCFQDFASELANLPGDYAPPRGCLLLLRRQAAADIDAGCVALRPIGVTGAAELKRLYLREAARGAGLGRRLTLAAIERARAIGYREIMLDTLATMTAAQALYASLGFRPCAPYYRNPLPGVVWLALDLVTSAPTEAPPSASR